MDSQTNNTFIVKDLYLSALLYAKGIKLLRVDRQGRVCWFVFSNKSHCEKLRQQFIARNIEVNVKEYTDALRTLKDLVFAEG